ncbi:STAS/SEC14 domain-containing protein [Planococcus sp. APC 3900]|uniref:STAS/SEC14 domain-containing protein n=1 Tax=Planococcus sp. APC 3900 TaxID=3035191 RepID=UPI0025B49DC4|nr:STAS/SEC14 domain-containing protein [Planococcus sp. APC 3900]MDN3439106.1 STAS/SEC14 domain-containing protein [Planococcus sp. APC 3900]
MLTFIPSQDSQTIAFKIEGTITKENLQELEREISERFSKDQPFNAYAVIGQVKVPTINALMEEVKIDMKRWSQYNKLAVVSEKNWLVTITDLGDLLLGIEAKHFKAREAEQAWNWIRA